MRLIPSSLFGRLTLILVAGLLAAQVASMFLHRGEQESMLSHARSQRAVERIVETIRVLEAATPEQRASALAALDAEDFSVSAVPMSQVSTGAAPGHLADEIAGQLGSEREMHLAGPMRFGPGHMGGPHGMREGRPPGPFGPGAGRMGDGMMRAVDIRLGDGQWVRVSFSPEPPRRALPGGLMTHLLLTIAAVIIVSLIAVRLATRPLQHLAEAADAFGQNLESPPLPETGPAETRRAAKAFNGMQERLKRLIAERGRALAAVSHDLRTPLTRLRLRAELVDDAKLREQIAADLDDMQSMIDTTLQYLRGVHENEPRQPIDMNALLASLAEDVSVLGHQVSVDGSATAPYVGRLSGLKRAIGNLVDNAVKYGQTAAIRVEDDAAQLRVIVEDRGPGIPEEQLAQVTEPYYRLDASRRRDTGGVGLGLAIARDVALHHGGDLVLANRPEGGLRATLVLPRRSARSATGSP
jgi:signal transduction histidine kinase